MGYNANPLTTTVESLSECKGYVAVGTKINMMKGSSYQIRRILKVYNLGKFKL